MSKDRPFNGLASGDAHCAPPRDQDPGKARAALRELCGRSGSAFRSGNDRSWRFLPVAPLPALWRIALVAECPSRVPAHQNAAPAHMSRFNFPLGQVSAPGESGRQPRRATLSTRKGGAGSRGRRPLYLISRFHAREVGRSDWRRHLSRRARGKRGAEPRGLPALGDSALKPDQCARRTLRYGDCLDDVPSPGRRLKATKANGQRVWRAGGFSRSANFCADLSRQEANSSRKPGRRN
jgi:hypothetical protein